MPRIAAAIAIATVLVAAPLLLSSAQAGAVAPRPGWAVHDTDQSYAGLLDSVKAAIKAEGMFLVTEAGPTEAAKSRGITIPGNRVLGVYRNDFAVRALAMSTAAMIEAPIRLYVTENPDGTATLSYKMPSAVFAPYLDEGGAELAAIGAELDGIFAAIAERATSQ
jgi:uncharacterized protein (DUF302 family)